MLNLNNIRVTLNKGTNLERNVLDNFNLTVNKKEFIVIIGANGAGKSTLFNIISGSIYPNMGNILLDNQDITSIAQNSRAPFISKVMQDPRVGTFAGFTILENMAFAFKRGEPRRLTPYLNKKDISYFKEKLNMLNMGLEDRLDEQVGNLSGGQRQALSLIMAILRDYKLLLLDEITAALDPKTADRIMQITNLIVQEQGKTCIMITHNMNHAAQYGNRLCLLNNGTIECEYQGTAKTMLSPNDLLTYFYN